MSYSHGATRQPFLHRTSHLFAGVTQAWSGLDGQVRAETGFAGFFHSDVRVLSRAVLTVAGEEPELLACEQVASGQARFTYAVRSIDTDEIADPLVQLVRTRTVRAGTVEEELTVSSQSRFVSRGRLVVELACDLAGMDASKAGAGAARAVAPTHDVVGRWVWADAATTSALHHSAELRTEVGPADGPASDDDAVRLVWDLDLPPGETRTATWRIEAHDTRAVVARDDGAAPWTSPEVTGDRRLARWVDVALDDLDAMRMHLTAAPEHTFLGAGIPWFQTLYGRDSLWTAQMMLPLGWHLAAGTLGALAAFQGTKVDPVTCEAPGKMLHEIRRHAPTDDQRAWLPPVYYGSIDATLLWVCVLHDAWRAGMPLGEIAALRGALVGALEWIRDHGDPRGTGVVEYLDVTGSGLANQGWKDSGDSVQFADGTQATGPIALVEVQGYAYQALISGADLLDALDGPGAGQEWRALAEEKKRVVRERFWVADERGPYLAMALDGTGRPVDAVASNMGHLLGSGILTPQEERVVADRLVADDMFSGYGVRTMSTTTTRYWPLRYHGGSVWPHDTALIARAMARAGLADHARTLAHGLLDAAEAFDYRVPELWGGHSADQARVPVPYGAACPVINWSASTAITVADVLGALYPQPTDAPIDTVKEAAR